jgi:two-component system, NarL family, nitrate/nitrite response regulator NarL
MIAPVLPRVLLVDDHEGLLQAWRRLLAPSCVIVGAVMTGVEALARADESRPDVVVLDNFLPDGIGIALCPKFRAIAPHVRVVLVSGDDDENTASAALRAGASEFVAKSCSGAELERAIARAFNGAPSAQHE